MQFFLACLQVKTLLRPEKKRLLQNLLPVPYSKKDIFLYIDRACPTPDKIVVRSSHDLSLFVMHLHYSSSIHAFITAATYGASMRSGEVQGRGSSGTFLEHRTIIKAA